LSAENIELLKSKGEEEATARLLGIKLLELSEGHSQVSMTIKPEHLNFAQVTYGGIVMTLADTAFGYAVNSIHFPTLAAQFNTHLLSGSKAGDILTAEALVLRAGRRVIVAEVSVTNQASKLIAKATGTSIPLDEPSSKM